MLTVLIAEQHHIDAIKKDNSLFFEPFLKDRNLKFCEWKPEGQTLKEAVPELLNAVGRTKEWRAVIIHSTSDEQKKQQNPFDENNYDEIAVLKKPAENPQGRTSIDENTGLEKPDDNLNDVWQEWENAWVEYYEDLAEAKNIVYSRAINQPLTRLTTWLCFRPTEYVLRDVNNSLNTSEWALRELSKREGVGQTNNRIELKERELYKSELRLKEMIRRALVGKDSINIAHPTEIYGISERITENGFFSPDNYWVVHSNNDYSEFADRNLYFDQMRFMVFDVLPQSHRNYRSDYIRFLYAVLVFSSNPMPASVMQARRLYLLDLENDDTPLNIMATSYEKKLTSTIEVIENEIDRIKADVPGELTDKEAAALFLVPTDVPITLDQNCNMDIVDESEHYGLASDCPDNELKKWSSYYSTIKKEMAYIIKQHAQSIRKSVKKIGYFSEVSGENVYRLNSFQMDDLREYTENEENEMFNMPLPDIGDSSIYMKPVNEKYKKVEKIMETRMNKISEIVLGIVVLLLFFLSFLPLLFSNMATRQSTRTAVAMILIMLAIVLIIMIVTLIVLRIPLVSAITDFNDEVTSALGRIRNTMNSFSKYFSAICNVRRGNAALYYHETHPDEFAKSIRIRKKHEEDIRKKRAVLLENYSDYILDRTYYDDDMIRPYDYDFNLKREYEYPAPFLAGDFRQVDFLMTGNKVEVPSSYVKRITLKMEDVYVK